MTLRKSEIFGLSFRKPHPNSDWNMAATTEATYAAKAGKEFPTQNAIGGKPVFIKNKDIPSVREKQMTNEEMYKCVLSTVNGREIKGVQKIGGLWRIYVENQESRIKLITNGMNVRCVTVAVYDKNPFIPGEKENSLRITVRNIPLSVHESLILDELEKLKYKVIGKVTYQRLRVDGRMTDCLTGDRVVYIEQPSQPLPRDMTFGIFKAKIYHYGQPDSFTRSVVVCSKCLSEGHHRSRCTSQVVCRRCKQPGHMQLDCSNSFETPPTSPSRARASGATPFSAPADAPSVQQTFEAFISAERRATEAVNVNTPHHDNQTRTAAQPKITQYLVGDREAERTSRKQRQSKSSGDNQTSAEPVNANTIHQSADSLAVSDAHEITSSEESQLSDEEELNAMSEISVESPEYLKHPQKNKNVKQTKRKQKTGKKLPKKK